MRRLARRNREQVIPVYAPELRDDKVAVAVDRIKRGMISRIIAMLAVTAATVASLPLSQYRARHTRRTIEAILASPHWAERFRQFESEPLIPSSAAFLDNSLHGRLRSPQFAARLRFQIPLFTRKNAFAESREVGSATSRAAGEYP